MAISIATSAVLIDLNISVWTARKLDKRVSKEIDINKGTTTNAGNYNKHLLAGSDQLEKIQKLSTEIRDWHSRYTLPWSDGGTRLLPMTNFFDYKQQLGEYEHEFNQRVEEFITNYPNIITSMAYKLGQLFDRSEYPEAEDIRNKFRLRYTIMPCLFLKLMTSVLTSLKIFAAKCACWKGNFLGIECKANGNRPTALQIKNLVDIEKAGGKSILIDETNVELLELIITGKQRV
jgi:hypothetical protein